MHLVKFKKAICKIVFGKKTTPELNKFGLRNFLPVVLGEEDED